MKIIVRTVAGIALLIVVGGAGLYLYLTPEKLRDLVVPRLSATLERKVGLESISLSLFAGVNAVAEGVSIQERDGFGPKPFISASRMKIAIPILPLITGEGELGAVTLPFQSSTSS